MGLQAAWVLHLGDLPRLFLDAQFVQRECRRLVLHLQIALVHPHGDILTGKPQFSVEFPMLEPDKALAINLAGKLRGVQRVREHLVINTITSPKRAFMRQESKRAKL